MNAFRWRGARRLACAAVTVLAAPRAFPRLGAARAESLAALAACFAAAVLVSRRLLRGDVVSGDAMVHQYWMRHWTDPQLFNDPLTEQLRGSARYPDGYQGLFWVVTHVVDPIAFGEWLGVGLMALSGWLVFRIVREHEAWRPAAWIGAALFLSLIEVHRFHGGFPRAFVHPAVLITVLLAIRRREPAAALVAAGSALFYPPAAVLAVGVLVVSGVFVRRLLPYAALAAGLSLAAVLVPRVLAGGAPAVMSAAQARAFAEFGDHGPLHFFVPSIVEYLSQNRSGFDLRTAGSILAVAAIALLAFRWRDVRRLRPEVLAMPVASLGAFALAQAVLFRLYLPHRYTYPLVAFFAIAIAVLLRPAWESMRHNRLLLAAPAVACAVAVYLFPLAPLPVAGAALKCAAALLAGAALAFVVRSAAAGAIATAGLLLALLLTVPHGLPRGNVCPQSPVVKYLSSLPRNAIVAGDPADLMCIPVSARRPVVTSIQLAPSYEVAAFQDGRARMFADLNALYGQNVTAISDLHSRYGATHLWVRRDAVRHGGRWKAGQLPYGRYVKGLLARGEPASLRLPAACRTFARGPVEVYDIDCVSSSAAPH